MALERAVSPIVLTTGKKNTLFSLEPHPSPPSAPPPSSGALSCRPDHNSHKRDDLNTQKKTGQLQAAYYHRHVGRQLVLHHSYRLSDEHARVGARRLQVHRFHEDRHAVVSHLPRAWVPAGPADFPLLRPAELSLFFSLRLRCLALLKGKLKRPVKHRFG